MRTRDVAAAAAALLVFALAYFSGLLYNVVVNAPTVALILVFVSWIRNRRRQAAGTDDPLGAINRAVFWALVAVVAVGAVPKAQFEPGVYRVVVAMPVVGAQVLMLWAARTKRAAPTARKVITLLGSLFLTVQLVRTHLPMYPQPTALRLAAPFSGRWIVVQGGPSALLNHHFPIRGQRDALDVVPVPDPGDVSRQEPADLTTYPCFGRDILAPADGTVVEAVGDLRDHAAGQGSDDILVGNHVTIQIAPSRFVLLAHLQRSSVSVAVGTTVRSGQVVGRCGNSGNSTEPHLHIQVQSAREWDAEDASTVPMDFGSGPPHRNDTIDGPRPS